MILNKDCLMAIKLLLIHIAPIDDDKWIEQYFYKYIWKKIISNQFDSLTLHHHKHEKRQ